MTEFDIIIRPLLTEKSYGDLANKKYTFLVNKNANKIQIKNAIEKIYDKVKVEKVNTANYDGKMKTQGRTQGYTASYKKAYVTLKEDSAEIKSFESLK